MNTMNEQRERRETDRQRADDTERDVMTKVWPAAADRRARMKVHTH